MCAARPSSLATDGSHMKCTQVKYIAQSNFRHASSCWAAASPILRRGAGRKRWGTGEGNADLVGKSCSTVSVHCVCTAYVLRACGAVHLQSLLPTPYSQSQSQSQSPFNPAHLQRSRPSVSVLAVPIHAEHAIPRHIEPPFPPLPSPALYIARNLTAAYNTPPYSYRTVLTRGGGKSTCGDMSRHASRATGCEAADRHGNERRGSRVG